MSSGDFTPLLDCKIIEFNFNNENISDLTTNMV